MDIKQKSLLIITIGALGFLGYQIFELVDRDISETPAITASSSTADFGRPAVHMTHKAPMIHAHQDAVASSQHVALARQANAVPVNLNGAKKPHATVSGMNPSQQAYVKMLNTFEVEKMHRQLLDEEAAVANAQHQIAMMHQQTSKLTGSATGDDVSDHNAAPLALSYIDHQRGHWNATVRLNQQYQSVQVGSRLSTGFQVVSIDKKGILLQKGQQRERLTFNGVQPLPDLVPTTHVPLLAAKKQAHPLGKGVVPASSSLITMDQAHLLAMQMAHHSQEVSAVARHALAVTKSHPAAPTAKSVTTQLSKRSPPKKPIQISTHDQYATESIDDRESRILSKDLGLRDTSIDPVVHEPYSVSAYLPEQDNVPRAYHLNLSLSPQASADRFATEGADGTTSVSHHYTAQERHFLKINHHRYTIQLIGSHDDAVVKQFLVDNEMKHVAMPMVVGNPHKPWHIAIYGVYRSFDAAEHKLVHLPHRLRVNGAWIRKVGDIQSVLKEYHHG